MPVIVRLQRCASTRVLGDILQEPPETPRIADPDLRAGCSERLWAPKATRIERIDRRVRRLRLAEHVPNAVQQPTRYGRVADASQRFPSDTVVIHRYANTHVDDDLSSVRNLAQRLGDQTQRFYRCLVEMARCRTSPEHKADRRSLDGVLEFASIRGEVLRVPIVAGEDDSHAIGWAHPLDSTARDIFGRLEDRWIRGSMASSMTRTRSRPSGA
jgi:hypothetical protein